MSDMQKHGTQNGLLDEVDRVLERAIENRQIDPSSDRTASLTQWQPIETAPRDGTDILLSSTGWFGDVLVGCWSFGGWRDRDDSDRLNPTHWMHLPEAPSAYRPTPSASEQEE